MDSAPIEFLPLGAIIQSFTIPNTKTNIVLGFPTQELYTQHPGPHFGRTIGRIANRIGDATFKLNSQTYNLAKNNGANSLHGGKTGWGNREWKGPTPVGVRQIPGIDGLEGGESVKFELVSGDMEDGFPGEVKASVVYTAGIQKVDGKEVLVLGMEYEAELVGGEVEETVVNMTNHSYFNLTGGPTIEGTEVTLCTAEYLPVKDGIPTSTTTGSFPNITANKAFTLGASEPDIDDCFVVSPSCPLDTRSSPLKKLVHAHHPDSKIHFEVYSTDPAFQFYTGKYIDVPAVEGYEARGPRSGFCVEPSRYVDAVNKEEWKSQVVLGKGQTYGSRIVYRGWSDE